MIQQHVSNPEVYTHNKRPDFELLKGSRRGAPAAAIWAPHSYSQRHKRKSAFQSFHFKGACQASEESTKAGLFCYKLRSSDLRPYETQCTDASTLPVWDHIISGQARSDQESDLVILGPARIPKYLLEGLMEMSHLDLLLFEPPHNHFCTVAQYAVVLHCQCAWLLVYQAPAWHAAHGWAQHPGKTLEARQSTQLSTSRTRRTEDR